MNLWLIPFFPLAGFAINGILGRRMPKLFVNAVAVGSVLLSFIWVLLTLQKLMPIETAYVEHYFTWIQSGALNISLDFAVDRLTAVMLLVITGVGTLIHIYSIGYMAHEGGYYRFFAYMNLFMFFMLTLVLGANFLILFVGWEGVGLCSYLLIGFYFQEKFAGDAGKKAFIVNRIGDFGFTLAAFLIVIHFGSLDFANVFAQARAMTPDPGFGWISWVCLLLFVGATGKSAQLPLYTWLPDAMAGPTPVSALIHAATMVTAGVYMVARSASLFSLAPIPLEIVGWVGLATAFFAGTIALAQNDIKKVFAYSTVSQLGYMFVAEGSGAYSAGIYHLMTHAFFKALLFLGAGSVIHALSGEQDLRQMGGLAKKIPITAAVLFCAGVAIAGLPFTSGAMSKDLILEAAYQHNPIWYWIGVSTAFMTAFYVFRALFMAFLGEYRGHHHPHESPLIMWAPLAILAVLSLGGGLFRVPVWLEPMFPLHEGAVDPLIAYLPFAAGFGGIILAYLFYVMSPRLPESIASAFSWPYKLIYNKYFVDEAYDSLFVNPILEGSRTLLWKGVDQTLIDGAVNGVGTRSRGIGNLLRLFQSGNIRSYAAWVVFGSILVIVYIGFGGVR